MITAVNISKILDELQEQQHDDAFVTNYLSNCAMQQPQQNSIPMEDSTNDGDIKALMNIGKKRIKSSNDQSLQFKLTNDDGTQPIQVDAKDINYTVYILPRIKGK